MICSGILGTSTRIALLQKPISSSNNTPPSHSSRSSPLSLLPPSPSLPLPLSHPQTISSLPPHTSSHSDLILSVHSSIFSNTGINRIGCAIVFQYVILRQDDVVFTTVKTIPFNWRNDPTDASRLPAWFIVFIGKRLDVKLINSCFQTSSDHRT